MGVAQSGSSEGKEELERRNVYQLTINFRR